MEGATVAAGPRSSSQTEFGTLRERREDLLRDKYDHIHWLHPEGSAKRLGVWDKLGQEERLGKGGLAVVFWGVLETRSTSRTASDTPRLVAVKRVETLTKRNTHNRHLGYEEAVYQSLSENPGNHFVLHPEAPWVNGEGDHGMYSYLALQLCHGNLHALVPLRLPIKDRLEIFHAICQAMHFIHTELTVTVEDGQGRCVQKTGVAHNDLKPDNILIQEVSEQHRRRLNTKYQPRIADFGSTRAADVLTSVNVTDPSSRYGTSGWMAPELFNIQRGVDTVPQSADIYSLGLIGFYLLATDSNGAYGFHPFDSREALVQEWQKREQCPATGAARQRNIMRNRPHFGDHAQLGFLEMIEDFEARNLIGAMLRLHADMRPDILQVLSHPVFWTKTVRTKHLLDLVGFVRTETHQQNELRRSPSHTKPLNPAVCDELFRLRDVVEADSWEAAVGQDIIQHRAISGYSGNSYHTNLLSSLCDIIRNCLSHIENDRVRLEELRQLYSDPTASSTSGVGLVAMWACTKFPRLLLALMTLQAFKEDPKKLSLSYKVEGGEVRQEIKEEVDLLHFTRLFYRDHAMPARVARGKKPPCGNCLTRPGSPHYCLDVNYNHIAIMAKANPGDEAMDSDVVPWVLTHLGTEVSYVMDKGACEQRSFNLYRLVPECHVSELKKPNKDVADSAAFLVLKLNGNVIPVKFRRIDNAEPSATAVCRKPTCSGVWNELVHGCNKFHVCALDGVNECSHCAKATNEDHYCVQRYHPVQNLRIYAHDDAQKLPAEKVDQHEPGICTHMDLHYDPQHIEIVHNNWSYHYRSRTRDPVRRPEERMRLFWLCRPARHPITEPLTSDMIMAQIKDPYSPSHVMVFKPLRFHPGLGWCLQGVRCRHPLTCPDHTHHPHQAEYDQDLHLCEFCRDPGSAYRDHFCTKRNYHEFIVSCPVCLTECMLALDGPASNDHKIRIYHLQDVSMRQPHPHACWAQLLDEQARDGVPREEVLCVTAVQGGQLVPLVYRLDQWAGGLQVPRCKDGALCKAVKRSGAWCTATHIQRDMQAEFPPLPSSASRAAARPSSGALQAAPGGPSPAAAAAAGSDAPATALEAPRGRSTIAPSRAQRPLPVDLLLERKKILECFLEEYKKWERTEKSQRAHVAPVPLPYLQQMMIQQGVYNRWPLMRPGLNVPAISGGGLDEEDSDSEDAEVAEVPKDVAEQSQALTQAQVQVQVSFERRSMPASDQPLDAAGVVVVAGAAGGGGGSCTVLAAGAIAAVAAAYPNGVQQQQQELEQCTTAPAADPDAAAVLHIPYYDSDAAGSSMDGTVHLHPVGFASLADLLQEIRSNMACHRSWIVNETQCVALSDWPVSVTLKAAGGHKINIPTQYTVNTLLQNGAAVAQHLMQQVQAAQLATPARTPSNGGLNPNAAAFSLAPFVTAGIGSSSAGFATSVGAAGTSSTGGTGKSAGSFDKVTVKVKVPCQLGALNRGLPAFLQELRQGSGTVLHSELLQAQQEGEGEEEVAFEFVIRSAAGGVEPLMVRTYEVNLVLEKAAAVADQIEDKITKIMLLQAKPQPWQPATAAGPAVGLPPLPPATARATGAITPAAVSGSFMSPAGLAAAALAGQFHSPYQPPLLASSGPPTMLGCSSGTSTPRMVDDSSPFSDLSRHSSMHGGPSYNSFWTPAGSSPPQRPPLLPHAAVMSNSMPTQLQEAVVPLVPRPPPAATTPAAATLSAGIPAQSEPLAAAATAHKSAAQRKQSEKKERNARLEAEVVAALLSAPSAAAPASGGTKPLLQADGRAPDGMSVLTRGVASACVTAAGDATAKAACAGVPAPTTPGAAAPKSFLTMLKVSGPVAAKVSGPTAAKVSGPTAASPAGLQSKHGPPAQAPRPVQQVQSQQQQPHITRGQLKEDYYAGRAGQDVNLEFVFTTNETPSNAELKRYTGWEMGLDLSRESLDSPDFPVRVLHRNTKLNKASVAIKGLTPKGLEWLLNCLHYGTCNMIYHNGEDKRVKAHALVTLLEASRPTRR